MKCIFCENTGGQHQLSEDKYFECEFCWARYPDKWWDMSFDYNTEYEKRYPGMMEMCIKVAKFPNPVRMASGRGIPYEWISSLMTKIDDPTSVLDVGCGYGYFAWAMSTLQIDVSGLDISKKAIGIAKKLFDIPFYCEDIFTHKKKYDIIYSIEVLEHLNNPLAFIKRCIELSPRVLITTPTRPGESGPWISEEPPVHLGLYEPRTFEWAGRKLGVKVESHTDGMTLMVEFNKYD